MRVDWGEEKLRFRVLRAVYERAGHDCGHPITGSEIGAALHLRFEDLFRVVHFLEYHGYLQYLGAGPRVCITPKGLHYIDEGANRRQTVRTPDRHLVNGF
jgi:DNA-binding IclR family transcriptional regulator